MLSARTELTKRDVIQMVREIRDEEVRIPILFSPTPASVELLFGLLHLIHVLSITSDEYSAFISF